MRHLLYTLIILYSGCTPPDFITKHEVAVYLEPCGSFEYPLKEELERAYDFYLDSAPEALQLSVESIRGSVWYTALVLRCESWKCPYTNSDGSVTTENCAGRREGRTINLEWDIKYNYSLFHECAHLARKLGIGSSDPQHLDFVFWSRELDFEFRYLERI